MALFFVRILLLIASTGYANCWTDQQIRPRVYPPPPDRNLEAKYYRSIPKRMKDQLTSKCTSISKEIDNANCNLTAIAAATGNALINLIKETSTNCTRQISNVAANDPLLFLICTEAGMTTIAKALYDAASKYDAFKPSERQGIFNFAIYLSGCFYACNDNITIFNDDILNLTRHAVETFLQRPNLEAVDSTHIEIMNEIISLILYSHDYLHYTSLLALLVTKVGKIWTFPESDAPDILSQSKIINDIYDIIYQSHHDEQSAKEFYCDHPEVAQSLSEFMNKQAGLFDTNSEWLLRNTAGELARFTKYQCIYPQVSGWIEKQLEKYPQNDEKSYKMWAAIAGKLIIYDLNNCLQYHGVCTFKIDIEKKTLPVTQACNKSYLDTFKIRIYQISEIDTVHVCNRLKELESYFHSLLQTNWNPVGADTNNVLEVIVFNDFEDYNFYGNIIFGLNTTSSGGMYVEGNPREDGSISRLFCHAQWSDEGQFDIYALEHELTHYFDGRYNRLEAHDVSVSAHSIWWIEGLAEYVSMKNNSPKLIKVCEDKIHSLHTIFETDYSTDTERTYGYSYAATRFMFEKHRADIDKILEFFRAGQYTQFESFITGIGNRYDTEFCNWCTCIAKGEPC